MLLGKGNSDNGKGKKYPESQVGKAYPYSSTENPEDVHHQAQAATIAGHFADLLAKGPECQSGQFEGLQTKRNTDNGKA